MKFKALILALLLLIPSTRTFAAALDNLTVDAPQFVAMDVDDDDADDTDDDPDDTDDTDDTDGDDSGDDGSDGSDGDD